jgi:hypothetical protein
MSLVRGSSQQREENMADQSQNENDLAHRPLHESEKLRSQLCDDVEAFLKSGGKIVEVEPNVLADPPKKPVSNYGSRPI